MGLFTKKPKVMNGTELDKSIKKLVEALRSEHGVHVNLDTAFEVAAAYQAVNIISSQIALLPCPIYKINEKDEKDKDKKHPLYRLLNVQFNDYTTAYNGWRIFMANALLTTAGYIYIERKNGKPHALYPINTERVTKSIHERTLKPSYKINFGNAGTINVRYTDMIEVNGLTDDSTDEKDPIYLLRNILSLAVNAETFGKEYFENGLHPSGMFSMPGHLDEKRADDFKSDMRELYSGLGKRHKAMLLEDGMKFDKMTISPNEGQMTETRNFQILEIARFFNIPPTKLFHLERATWSNIEELNIQFVQETLAPWIIAIQQTLNMQLLMESEKEDHYIEFNFGGLLRGKMSERYDSYAKARQWGFMSVNEIRKLENLHGIGTQGDIFLTPVNMADSQKIGGTDDEQTK